MGCDVLVRAVRYSRFPWPRSTTAVQRMRLVCEGMPLLCRQVRGVSARLWGRKPRTDTFPPGSEDGSTPHASRYQLFASIRQSDDISTCPQCISSSVSSSSRIIYRFFFRIQVMSFVKVHIPDHRPSSSSISSTMTAARSDFENFACPSSRVIRQCCV